MKSMNSSISLPDPQRPRRTPARFSWIDHRLLRDGHLAACTSPEALALYLLLVAACDARGLSYYSDKRLGKLLGLDADRLAKARRRLIKNGLIAWRKPHYQVLSLDPEMIKEARLRDPSQQQDRSAQSISLQEALAQLSSKINATSPSHD